MKRFLPTKLLAMLAVILSATIVISSCSDDDEFVPTQSIVEIVQTTEGLDSLAKYVAAYPEIIAYLSGTTKRTLFAPNNAAFDGLLETPGFPDDISLINPAIIGYVLEYHAATEEVRAAQLGPDMDTKASTASDYEVSGGVATDVIKVNDDGTLLTGSTNAQIEVLEADLIATNGVVHVVESVMVPPSIGESLTPILGTNAGTILLGADFSILASAIATADAGYAVPNELPTLTSILAGSVTNTVFAPTNATFIAAGIELDDYTPEQWYGIIANHVVLQDVAPADLTNGATFTSAANATLTTIVADPVVGTGIFLESNGDATPDAEVALPDAAINSNGRVHVIAGVLVPPTPGS